MTLLLITTSVAALSVSALPPQSRKRQYFVRLHFIFIWFCLFLFAWKNPKIPPNQFACVSLSFNLQYHGTSVSFWPCYLFSINPISLWMSHKPFLLGSWVCLNYSIIASLFSFYLRYIFTVLFWLVYLILR